MVRRDGNGETRQQRCPPPTCRSESLPWSQVRLVNRRRLPYCCFVLALAGEPAGQLYHGARGAGDLVGLLNRVCGALRAVDGGVSRTLGRVEELDRVSAPSSPPL